MRPIDASTYNPQRAGLRSTSPNRRTRRPPSTRGPDSCYRKSEVVARGPGPGPDRYPICPTCSAGPGIGWSPAAFPLPAFWWLPPATVYALGLVILADGRLRLRSVVGNVAL